MIGSLKGEIIEKDGKSIILEVGGVGYLVQVSPEFLLSVKIGDRVRLLIHTYVREDILDLYGFRDEKELSFFKMLLGVSGIGPRSALAVLSVASIDTLHRAIRTGDTGYLTKISGIGRKTAEKIIIELRDKLGEDNSGEESLQGELDALEALRSLGYSEREAREALKKTTAKEAGERLREALKILGNK